MSDGWLMDACVGWMDESVGWMDGWTERWIDEIYWLHCMCMIDWRMDGWVEDQLDQEPNTLMGSWLDQRVSELNIVFSHICRQNLDAKSRAYDNLGRVHAKAGNYHKAVERYMKQGSNSILPAVSTHPSIHPPTRLFIHSPVHPSFIHLLVHPSIFPPSLAATTIGPFTFAYMFLVGLKSFLSARQHLKRHGFIMKLADAT